MMASTNEQPKSASMFGGQTSEGLVLVVDDEPDVRKVVRMVLEKAGYRVIEAEDGKSDPSHQSE